MIELHTKIANLLLDSISEALALIDDNEVVAWANAAFCARVGYSPENCCGRSLDALDPTGRNTEGRTIKTFSAMGIEAKLLRLPQDDQRIDTSLMGVIPKATALQRMDVEVSRSRRYGNPLSCMLLTVPEDTSSTDLSALARFLREQLRWVDITAWWDETTLLALLPETSEQAASELGRKLDEQSQGSLAGVSFQWSVGTWQRGDDGLALVVKARRGLVAACDQATA